jgi:hypothetical protein
MRTGDDYGHQEDRRRDRAGAGRYPRCAAGGAHSLPVPYRRCFRFFALRLPAAIGTGAAYDRRGRYELQDQGLDTVEANLRLGYKPDCREFELPAEILKLLKVTSVRLITNNPEKVEALESVGIRVVERISAEVEPLDSFERYVQVKQEKMGHIVDRVPELG